MAMEEIGWGGVCSDEQLYHEEGVDDSNRNRQ